jgi:hypothetical protein
MKKVLELLEQTLQEVRNEKNTCVKNQNYLEARALFTLEKDIVESINSLKSKLEFFEIPQEV